MSVELNKEITNNDSLAVLQNVLVSNECIKKQNDELKAELLNIKKDSSKEIEKLKLDNCELKEEVKNLKERVLADGRKLKKCISVFYGLEEEEDSLNDIKHVLSVINDKCEVECKFHDIRDLYRIGKIPEKTPDQ
ncbi:hypothetical protein JTB14_017591 [Gonioctena quinquepunctata]|nr:hypothetical protein JTB14_017591 [Gonioctena quinquepunctata]